MTTQNANERPGLHPNDAHVLDMGQEPVFDWIFRNYYAQLCDFSSRYLKSNDDAQEVVEELFLNLWKKKEIFNDLNHIRSFLYRSAYNISLNKLRSTRRTSEREEIYSQQVGFMEDNYLNNLLRAELIGEIYRQVENLPEQYAKVIKMSFQEGLKNEEIADQLGLSMQTVKNYKTKGLAILKSRLPKDAWVLLCASILLR